MTPHTHKNIKPSAVETIGDTPLVELSQLTEGLSGRLLVKLEMYNPGASKKDRIARQIVEDAEAEGQLTPNQTPPQTIVEHTSGNTGTGLAVVSAVRGYHFVAVMSKGNSEERARMMRALGAEVVLVDQVPGATPGQVSGDDWQRVEDETQRLIVERDAFHGGQFYREGNFRAHYLHTGPEIIEQCRRGGGGTGGEISVIDAFCDFVGSGGTFAGCARALKEHNPAVKCFVAEPSGAAVMAGEPVSELSHSIQGGGYAKDDLSLMRTDGREADIDGYIQVTSDEAVQTARRLAAEEGIFAGVSSGANVAAALQLLNGEMKGKTVVTLINDSGLKYLSTDLWA